MDACVRDHAVEERRIKEMQTYFDSIPASACLLLLLLVGSAI